MRKRRPRPTAGPLLAALLLLATLPAALPPATPAEAAVEAGSFRRELLDSLTGFLTDLAIGDVNNDGRLDVVGAGLNMVGRTDILPAPERLYLNTGAGLGRPQPFGGANDVTRGLALGDVDGDGYLDLVTGNYGPEQLYLGDGSDNPFTLPIAVGGSDDQTESMALGDFDGDGYLDLVTGGPNALPRLYRFDPRGRRFGPGEPLAAESTFTVSALAAGDVDADGTLDLVAAGPNALQLYLNFNTGDGRVLLQGIRIETNNQVISSVALGDVNGDGYLDLIADNRLYLNTRSLVAFSTYSIYTAPSERATLPTLGDMDGDGDLDLLVTDFQSNDEPGRERLYLNDGSPGLFAPGATLPLSEELTGALALGDLDGDGDLDLVSSGALQAGGLRGSLWLFRNEGAIQPFVSSEAVPVSGEEINAAALGDVDRDGDLDLVTAGFIEQVALYNATTRRFAPPAAIPGSEGRTDVMALGDLDSDGDLDLVTADLNLLQLYLFDETRARFGAPVVIPVTANGSTVVKALALGELDGNGSLDLVVSTDTGEFVFGYDLGRRRFELMQAVLGSASPTNALALVDVNADGRLDLVSGNEGAELLHLGFAGGAFAVGVAVPGTEGLTRAIQVADVDGDGAAELITDQLRVHRYDAATGNFGAGVGLTDEPDARASALAVGDFDADGFFDIVASAESGAPGVFFRYNRATGRFDAGLEISGPATGEVRQFVAGPLEGLLGAELIVIHRHNGVFAHLYRYDRAAGRLVVDSSLNATGLASDVALGDVNGDGLLDLVRSGFNTDLWLNGGEGLFGGAPHILASGSRSNAVALGDFNGDTRLDLIAAREGEEYFFPNLGEAPYLRDSVALDDSGDESASLAFGDLDGDGDLDLVTGNLGPARAYLNLGGEPVPRTRGVNLAVAGNGGRPAEATFSLALGDLDGDGDLDLVTGNALVDTNGALDSAPERVYLNVGGDAIFAPGFALPGSDDATIGAALGDLDGDGDLDLVTANQGLEQIYLNEGGAGIFAPPIGVADSADDSTGLALGDVDGDGDLDLVTGNSTPSVLNRALQAERLYLNRGPATLLAPAGPIGGSTDRTNALALGDLDGDGDGDLVTIGDLYGRVFFNQLAAPLASPDRPAVVDVAPPGATPEAEHLATGAIQAGPLITVPLTLSDAEGDPVRELRAFYSLDGGGSWRPAVAASGTITRNLATLAESYAAPLAFPTPLPDVGEGTYTMTVTAPANGAPGPITDVDVTLRIVHPDFAGLSARLVGPDGTAVTLFEAPRVVGQGFEARFDDEGGLTLGASPPPLVGHFKPAAPLAAFDGRSPVGAWKLVVSDTNPDPGGAILGPSLHIRTAGVRHSFVWDRRATEAREQVSLGQSDRVALRFEALSGAGAGDTFERPYATATSALFRVRGTQPRVLDWEGQPVEGALVYRLWGGQLRGAAPLANPQSGAPQTTVALGYLSSREPLNAGDRLVALRPISATDTYSLYLTSATPISTGLDLAATTVPTRGGVLDLTITRTSPLVLFNLDVSLEWDARDDRAFLDRLAADVSRASDLLYDWSDGQVALGDITVYQDRERWDDAHIRVYATNRLRPNAVKGGIVVSDTLDPGGGGESYYAGQLRMGSVWNRYGDPAANQGDDWARTLAHELGHYALYLDDNYLGLDRRGALINVSTCRGAMADPYRDDYSEFHPRDAAWETGCADTLSERLTGRADWETIAAFYDLPARDVAMNPPATFGANPGPSILPLAVTHTRVITPAGDGAPLDNPVVLLLNPGGGPYTPAPGGGARGFLFQERRGGDRLIDLGAPTVDQLLARGARPGDRVCLFEPERGSAGCAELRAGYQALRLAQRDDWRPDVRLIGLDETMAISVTVHGVPAGARLFGQLYPSSAPAQPPVLLAPSGGDPAVYAAELPSPAGAPAFEGFVAIWIDEGNALTRRQAVVEYRLGGNPARKWARGAPRGNPARKWARGAPVLSSDGQVILFVPDSAIPEGSIYTLLASNTPPGPPSYATPVSRAYRLTATAWPSATGGLTASLSVGYFSDDVPRGYEAGIGLYRYDEAGERWLAVEGTDLDTARNEAVAAIPGPGLYQLMTSATFALQRAGWNLVYFYPGGDQPLPEALASIEDQYRSVYGYEANATADSNDDWRLYSRLVPGWVNDLAGLEYGESYWIETTEPTTATVRPQTQAATLDQSGILAPPPATYYADLTGSVAAGAPATASIGGLVCGRGEARASDGRVVLVLDVLSEGSRAGCGLPGREVSVAVGGLTFVRAWQSGPAALRETGPLDGMVYLPLVAR